MIDHDRRLIFIHVPKTAGVSVYHALGRLDEQGHMTLDDYPEHRDRYFSFAFVRNPWDRLLSCFLYFKRGGRGVSTDVAAQQALSDCPDFDTFARALEEYRSRLARIPALAGSLPHYPHLLGQTFWTHDDAGNQRLTRIGRFERLERDFESILAEAGIDARLPAKNTTEHDDYRTYYDRCTREVVARAYRDDVERYGYSF